MLCWREARKPDALRRKDNPVKAIFGQFKATAGIGVLMLALMVSTARAQYSIDWYKISGGGGASASGQYLVSGTIGQPDAGGPMTGGKFSLIGGFWSLCAVQTFGAPTLFIVRSDAGAILSWSATAGSFVLEQSTNLAATNGWSAVPATPVNENGFNFVTNGMASGNHFHRLRCP